MAHGHEPLMSIELDMAQGGTHLSEKAVKNEVVSETLWPHNTPTKGVASGSIVHG